LNGVRGSPQSVFCARCRALAKAGKSVLLIDPSHQYGGAWATLSMDQVPTVARPAEELAGAQPDAAASAGQAAGCRHVPIDSDGSIAISNLVQYTDGTDQGASPQVLVDLTPKVRRPGCWAWVPRRISNWRAHRRATSLPH
jgi:RAB protein geranylgeranyltransferase component A